jgi:galactokinase
MDKIYHFSAPGRTEIGGNHTDHQHGCVLAAAVDMTTTAEVTLNGTNVIRVDSEGYRPVEIDLGDLNAKESERNTTAALIRGVAAAFAQRGYKLAGFDAKVKSTVLPGSGLSSSAAFEVLIGRILNGLFADNAVSAIEIAQIGQYAENVYYGKPSGLMDQMASSVGGLVFIDFNDPKVPVVEKVDYDFTHSGYTLCTIDAGADHADLTDEYAAIPAEMKQVARFFGKEVLREVDEKEFYKEIAELRKETGDRAVLRAIHFFNENRRVQLQVRALKSDHFDAFLRYVNESGMASWTLLQNVTPAGYIEKQDMAFTIALCQQLLGGEGAVRVHGGGFAGTALAFVPNEKFAQFKEGVEAVLGADHCHKLQITENSPELA